MTLSTTEQLTEKLIKLGVELAVLDEQGQEVLPRVIALRLHGCRGILRGIVRDIISETRATAVNCGKPRRKG